MFFYSLTYLFSSKWEFRGAKSVRILHLFLLDKIKFSNWKTLKLKIKRIAKRIGRILPQKLKLKQNDDASDEISEL